MRATIEAARLAASTDSTVLLTGESGAGKDYIARFIHDHSRRRDRLFYAVNCAAIPLELAESELFGYESGAFTGAKGAKRGMLDIPQGGTLLLNEIGELPLPIQAKLLAFLDTKSFTRVGGERPVFADVRLLAATNRDLRQEISEDRFREDLFYRLNVLSVRVPPLRERTEDIPLLARQIIAELGEKMRLAKLPVLQAETLAAMQRHHWPGNVRELRNLLERTLILFGQEEMIPERSLQLESDQAPESKPALSLPHDKSLGDLFEDMEKSLIEEALRLSSGKKEAAAKLLGISRHALKRRLQKYADLRAKTLKQIKPMA
jgi:transcriptional regulator with PAS, ATPase and Fis domain